VFIWFQEHRCQIGTFQEITRKFEIPPKKVSPRGCTWHEEAVCKGRWPMGLGVAGRPHLSASRGLASRWHSPRGDREDTLPLHLDLLASWGRWVASPPPNLPSSTQDPSSASTPLRRTATVAKGERSTSSGQPLPTSMTWKPPPTTTSFHSLESGLLIASGSSPGLLFPPSTQLMAARAKDC
jgi:hypothetical protein